MSNHIIFLLLLLLLFFNEKLGTIVSELSSNTPSLIHLLTVPFFRGAPNFSDNSIIWLFDGILWRLLDCK